MYLKIRKQNYFILNNFPFFKATYEISSELIQNKKEFFKVKNPKIFKLLYWQMIYLKKVWLFVPPGPKHIYSCSELRLHFSFC